ncbi:MAG: TolC family protein [Lacunisphaera sp.]|nr:TolC family protein [Lacunisphaera sp.]
MKSISFFLRLCPLPGLLLALTGRAQPAPEPAAPASVPALVDHLLAHNPEIAFYEAEIDAAQAGQRAAGARANPELSLSVGRKRVTDPAGVLAGEGTAWSVSLSQTFEWPGRLSLRKAIANRDLDLAELGLARFKAALANRARTLAYGLHAAHERAAAAAAVAARYQALRELFLAREPGGITPLLEARVIEAQELTLQQRATDARLAAQAAVVEFNQLRGLPVDAPLTLAPAKLALGSAPDRAVALAAARENTFEFRAARIELEQQGLVVSLARGEGRPGFTVSPYLSQESAGDKVQTLGLGLSLPLPVGGRTGAGIAAAEARRRQAGTAVLVAQRTMERAVITSTHRLAAKLAEAAAWSPDAARRFRDAAELADRHYRLGAVPISTYVELQNSYLGAIDSLYATQQEVLEAAGTLQLLTGLEFGAVEIQP